MERVSVSCKFGILNGVCIDEKRRCKFYNDVRMPNPCLLYEILNEKFMADKEISTFNIFLGGLLNKE